MTNTTQQLSPTALLAQVIEHNVLDWNIFQNSEFINPEITSEITDIWLPLFKSEKTFSDTLKRLQIAFGEGSEFILCHQYLSALKGLANEDL
jgi:hypothetical protein